MPVTAKLSKLFYDRLGEEIAEELVSWLNSAEYGGNMRQLNEITLARFDAKLEQRLGTLETNLKSAVARLEARIETRLR